MLAAVCKMITTREIADDADGLTMIAHLACPQGDGPWPTVLIGHDGIGLDDYQRGRADDLASHGYLAMAMDYHGGKSFFGDPEGMLARVIPLMADTDRMQTIGQAALDVLLAVPELTRLGSVPSATARAAVSCCNSPAPVCRSGPSPSFIPACQPPAPRTGSR